MACITFDPNRSVVLLIDLQSALTLHIEDGDRVVRRARFLIRAARQIGIPVFATEQNPARMGATVEELSGVATATFGKMTFDAWGSEELRAAVRATGRTQVVLTGVETHICVSLTALSMLNEGFEVAVCPDAVGARTMDRHKLGMERLRDAGVVPVHTESVVYEWLGSAEHPHFRDILNLVKAHS